MVTCIQFSLHIPRLPRDEDLRTIQTAAEKGVVHKQIELGSAYVMGYGVAQDLRLVAYWSHKAAEKGDPAAQNQIGDF